MNKPVSVVSMFFTDYLNFKDKASQFEVIAFISVIAVILFIFFVLGIFFNVTSALIVFILYSFMPAMSVQARRWNDLNQSPVFAIFSLVPFISPFAIIYLAIKQSPIEE